MFENFRQSLNDLFQRGVQPHERSAILASMRETLVRARAGIADVQAGLATTRARLAAEERELETVRRRRQLAEGIGDAETVGVAAKYESLHAERVAVLAEKLRVQESELALVEREVAEMTQALKSAMAGVPAAGVGPTAAEEANILGDLERDLQPPDPSREIDALGRARARATREADAEQRLEELKRRMGK